MAPRSVRTSGRPNRRKFTSAATGFPGSAKTCMLTKLLQNGIGELLHHGADIEQLSPETAGHLLVLQEWQADQAIGPDDPAAEIRRAVQSGVHFAAEPQLELPEEVVPSLGIERRLAIEARCGDEAVKVVVQAWAVFIRVLTDQEDRTHGELPVSERGRSIGDDVILQADGSRIIDLVRSCRTHRNPTC